MHSGVVGGSHDGPEFDLSPRPAACTFFCSSESFAVSDVNRTQNTDSRALVCE
jgi:hypothetical protein